MDSFKHDNKRLNEFIDSCVEDFSKLKDDEQDKVDDLNHVVLIGDDFDYCLHYGSERYLAGFIDGLKAVQKRLIVED